MEEVVLIAPERLIVTSQPIKDAKHEDKRNLFNSIKEIGLLYPIIVRPLDDARYEVLDGRTRLSIVRELGFKMVKCIVRRDEEVKDEVVPFDVEICRRHLTDDELRRFKEIRQEKKKQVESNLISHLISRLPRKHQASVRKFVEGLSEHSRRAYLKFLIGMSEPDLEDFLYQQSVIEQYDRLKQEKEALEIKLDRLEKTTEEEVARRCEDFRKKVEARLEEIKKQGVVIPEDPEEKTAFVKKVEEAVRAKMRGEIEQMRQVQEKNEEHLKEMRKALGDKEAEIERLLHENEDIRRHLEMREDIKNHFNLILNKSIGLDVFLKKIDTFRADLDALRSRLFEWSQRRSIGGEIADMTTENLIALAGKFKELRKVVSEVESEIASQLRDT